PYACINTDTTTITVNSSFISNQNTSVCQGDSVLIYGNYQSIAGTYYDSLQTINGCDSVLSITLSINPVYLSNTNSTICQGDSILIYGNYQSIAGTYYDSLQTISGCDSVLSTTLTVNPLPNVTLNNFNPDTICSNSNTVTLPNGSPSGGVYSGTGVNGGAFDPNTAGLGTHSVIYTYTDVNSCINSDSTFITVEQCVGIDDLENDLGILIYPNPNTGLFTIEKPMELDKEVKVSLLDATSRVIIDKLIPKGQQKIEMDITNYSKGIYYLQFTVEKKVFVKQILKN
ncbi:MAG: T9SS type A sorting domain-containing protein, partial [Flavobacteriales bacterium]|nr:T9SS type A sorting domain-containing protein [Flavobacteriales bacterium]